MNQETIDKDKIDSVIADVEEIIDNVIFPLEGDQIEDKGNMVIKKLRNLVIGYTVIPILGVSSVPLIKSFADPRISGNNHDFYYSASLLILGALLSTLIFVLNNQVTIDRPSNLKKLVVDALKNGALTYEQMDVDPTTAKFINNYFRFAYFLKRKRWNIDLEQ